MKDWIDKPFTELKQEMEDLFRKVKDAANYRWGNTHFFIGSFEGKPALKMLFMSDRVSFWNTKDGKCVYLNGKGPAPEKVTKEFIAAVVVVINAVESGLKQCTSCYEWKNPNVSKFTMYDFAGQACQECYNPKKHLPPDTRGD
jgi:hypothetical protein